VTHPWVADTTVLWGLASAEIIPSACALFPSSLHVTPAVREELTRHVTHHPFLQAAIDAIDSKRVVTLEPTAEELKRVFKLRNLWGLSPRDRDNFGEAEVVAVVLERSGGAILDDRRPRMTMSFRYPDRPLLDTPELLLHLVDAKQLSGDAAWQLLERMTSIGGFDHPMSKYTKSEYLGGRFYRFRTRI
jgi:hypothetical protein